MVRILTELPFSLFYSGKYIMALVQAGPAEPGPSRLYQYLSVRSHERGVPTT